MEDDDIYVLPGAVLTALLDTSAGAVKLGAGLLRRGEDVVACRAGHLRLGKQRKYRIDGNVKRYTAAVSDGVVGVVTGRVGESWRVDINGGSSALLDFLAFENVTRKTRPNLNVGALVYARVAAADADLEPELVCVNPATSKADGFGELSGGTLIACSIAMCHRLLAKNNAVLAGIGKHFPFETAVGHNGRVWVKASGVKQTVCVCIVLREVDALGAAADPAAVAKVIAESVRKYVQK